MMHAPNLAQAGEIFGEFKKNVQISDELDPRANLWKGVWDSYKNKRESFYKSIY